MKKAHFLLKPVVIVTSVLLVGLFVAYRAGAFPWLVVARPERDDPKNLQLVKESPLQSKRPTVMSGTKAMTPENFITGSTPSDPPPAKAEQPPPESPGDIRSRRYEPILGGSKSAPVFQNLPATEKPVRPK